MTSGRRSGSGSIVVAPGGEEGGNRWSPVYIARTTAPLCRGRKPALLREPNGRRDREVQGVGVERNELCQQPDDPLGILRPAHRHTVVLPSERYFGEAARAVVAHHRENVAVLRRVERAAHLERVLHVQGQDAAEELVDAERRARNDLIDDRAERRPFETEYQRVGVGIRVLHPLQVLAAWAVPGNGTRQQVIEDFGTVVPVRAPGKDRIEAEARQRAGAGLAAALAVAAALVATAGLHIDVDVRGAAAAFGAALPAFAGFAAPLVFLVALLVLAAAFRRLAAALPVAALLLA